MNKANHLLLLIGFVCLSVITNAQSSRFLNTTFPTPYIPVVAGANFGYSIEVDDSIAVIGAPFYRHNAARTGAAFVFKYNGTQWNKVAMLVASDTTANANLGYSVAVHGDVIVAGARGYNANQGAGYVYVKPNGGWSGTLTQTARLTGDVPNSASDVFLGFSATMQDSVIALGGTFFDNKGAVLVYVKPTSGWADTTQSATLLCNTSQMLDQMGYSVSMDGDVIVAGAINTVIATQQVGEAVVFEKPTGGWADTVYQSTKLRASSPSGGDLFSCDISISGDVVVVGAQTHTIGVNASQGAAYIYVRPSSGWDSAAIKTQNAILTHTNPSDNDRFGVKVDIKGDLIAVKATSVDTTYLYKKPSGGWSGNLTEDHQLSVSNFRSPSFSAVDVVIGKDQVITGFFNQLGSDNEGKIYSYDKPNAGWSDINQTDRLRMSSQTNIYDSFGSAVAIDGNIAIVGAYSDDELMPSGGKVYVLRYNGVTWQKVAILQPSEPANQGYFGAEIAIDGDEVAVSAWGMELFGTSSDKPTIFVFTKPTGGWSGTINEVARLTPATPAITGFGKSLAMDNGVIVVGAPEAGSGATQSGQAYVFVRPTGGWSGDINEDAVLKPSNPEAYGSCGTSVAIEGNVVVVTEPRGNVTGFDEGKAYVYYKPGAGWNGPQTETATLIAADKSNYEYLGYGVSISGKTIVVGCQYDFVTAQYQGSAYVFEEPTGGWVGTINSSAKLIASDGGQNHKLSSRFVKVENNLVFLSSVDHTINGNPNQGAVYIYSKPSGGWSGTIQEDKKFIAFDGQTEDYFGDAMDIDGFKMVIGASGDSSATEPYVGSAYFYNLFDIRKVTAINPDGLYGIGDTVRIQVMFDNPVTVFGGPALELNTGTTKQLATYAAGTGSDTIVFNYVVQEDDESLDLAYTSQAAIKLGAGTITMSGRNVLLNLPTPGEDSSLSKHKDIVIDGIRPGVVISTLEASPTEKDTFMATIKFDEDVDSFDITDIVASNANLSNFQKINDSCYTVDVSPINGGQFTVFVPFSVGYDTAGNGNRTSNELKMTYNQAGAPTVVITSNDSGRINKSPFEVTITFSEKVIEFDSADITVTNGTAGNLQTSDSVVYTADITPTIEGIVTVLVDSAVAEDLGMNGNYASNLFSLYYDPSRPDVTITAPVNGVTNQSPLAVTITFTEWVAGVEPSDFTLTNATLSNLQTLDSVVFTADVTPASVGLFTVFYDDSLAMDSATNPNTQSNIFRVRYDTMRPTVVITTNEPNPTSNSNFEVTIAFSEEVLGFGYSDITITGPATLNNLQSTDNIVYTVDVDGYEDSGTVTLVVPEFSVNDSAGNPNHESNKFSILYDTKISVPQIVLESQTRVYPNPASGQITVKADWLTGKGIITITDLQGRVVMEQEIDSQETQLDITGLKQGVYFLRVESETGVVIKKISVI